MSLLPSGDYYSPCCNAPPEDGIEGEYYPPQATLNVILPYGRCSKCRELRLFESASDLALEEVDW